MAEASRTKKSIRNSLVALCFFAVNLLLNFFSRKIFLEYLGTEILGLNATAQNLLEFLNLAELGIGSAVGFTLYKPLHDNDNDTINEIVTLQGHLYKRIAWMIIAGACVLMAFFPLIFKKMDLPLWYAFAAFGVFLFSALLGYFFNYKQILLTSSQNDYKLQYSYRAVLFIKVLAQMWAVYALPNGYFWWLVFEVVFAVIASVSLHITTKRTFPYLEKTKHKFKELRKKHSFIVIKIKQVFFHKIGYIVLTQSAPLIIYALIDLNVVAIYGNYTIITLGTLSLIGAMFNSLAAGLGNLIEDGDRLKVIKVFEELFLLRFLIASSLSLGVFALGSQFIRLWIGEEYVLPTFTLFLIVVQLFINLLRTVIENFVNAFGLYGDIWAPVIEAILNISLSVILGKIWGLNGIIIGVIISIIIVPLIWRSYYLISRRMKGFGWEFLGIFIVNLIVCTVCALFILFAFQDLLASVTSFISLIYTGIIVISSYLILVSLLLWPFSNGMKGIVLRAKTFSSKLF